MCTEVTAEEIVEAPVVEEGALVVTVLREADFVVELEELIDLVDELDTVELELRLLVADVDFTVELDVGFTLEMFDEVVPRWIELEGDAVVVGLPETVVVG